MTAEEFKKLRQWIGTQRYAAEQLGYDVASLRRFENGVTPIPKVLELAIHCLTHHPMEIAHLKAIFAIQRKKYLALVREQKEKRA